MRTLAYAIVALIIVALIAAAAFILRAPTEAPATQTPTPGPAKWSIIIATGGVGGVYFLYGGVVAGI